MKKLFFATLLVSGLSVLANDVNDRIFRETYDKGLNNVAINCEYKYYINSPEVQVVFQEFDRKPGASAQFKIGDDLVSVMATEGGKRGRINFSVNGIPFKASLKQLDGITLDLEELPTEQSELAQKLNLASFDCALEIGRENHHIVQASKLHINVHPHPGFDVYGRTLPHMQRELDRTDIPHLVLLDHHVSDLGKIRGANFNHIMNGTYQAPQISFGVNQYGPSDLDFPTHNIDFKVSQAGHNKYVIKNPDQTIVFTGGNHNFCILNNTRRLLHGFMENPHRRSINFEYITDAIVVQRGWFIWLKNGNIPRSVFKKSNRLSDVLTNMSEKQKRKYINAHQVYIANSYLTEKQYYFSKAIVRSTGVEGAEFTTEVDGMGEGEIEINLIYK